jgi:phosphatidylglycerol:prolipoprotein diacylglycerol transferase
MTDFISFPSLGINFNVDRVAFSLFGHDIYWYGIIIAFGFALAVANALILSKKYGLKKDTVLDVVVYATPCAIIGARLYYVIFNWQSYAKNPADIFKIWNGGIAIYGAIIAAVIVTVIYCKKKKENLRLFCDIGAISLLIGQSIGRWGNFINQEAFGTNTTLPWGMTGSVIKEELESLAISGINVNPSIPVHPTFLYESLWNALFIVVFLLLFKKRRFDGEIFLSYLISYGVGRFFIEGLRTDSLMIGPFRVSQIVSLILVCMGVGLLIYNYKKPIKTLTLPKEKYEELQKN